MKKTCLFILVSLLLYACNKEEHHIVIDPPADDTTSFIIPASEDIVMYEVNLRAFSPGGDFQGVLDRLGDIKSLGINVIWLMPIYPVGEVNSVNSPYCVKDYKAVNSEFGTLSDLKTLVKEAHKQGIAIILDWVANHTAWDNPWIVNKDWYTQDGSGNIVHPQGTNWLDVADLDYTSLAMRLSMIDAMEYWISVADIDGFRCDAADMVPYSFWLQAIDSVSGFTAKNLVWLAEGARLDHFAAGFQMNYSWDFYNKLKSVFINNQAATGLVAVHAQEYASIPEGKHKLRFTTNHDESAWDATPIVLFNGEQGALAASVAAICLGGVPLIYGSQEVGTSENVPFFSNSEIDWSQHPEMLQAYKDLLRFHNGSDALKKGSMTSYSDSDVLAFSRISEPDEVFVLINLRNKTIRYDVIEELQNSSWKDAFNDSAFTLNASIDLEAYEYIVVKK